MNNFPKVLVTALKKKPLFAHFFTDVSTCSKMVPCVYACVCMHVGVCMCMHLGVCMCMHVGVYVYACGCVCVCMCVCVCVCMWVCMCMHVGVYVYVYVQGGCVTISATIFRQKHVCQY